jgi:hypothetical protein
MSQPNGRGTVDVNAATLLLAETPTVIVNDHVAVVGEWARPATVASAEQAATLIFDRAPANRPIDIHPLDWLLVSIVPERTLLALAPPTPSQPRTAATRPLS